MTIDDLLYLVGDEDGAVTLRCREHDLGNMPIAYFTTDPNDIYYRENPRVVCTNKITEFFAAGKSHLILEHFEDIEKGR